MKRTDLTNGIIPPKFKVGRYVLNEYEVREMVALISEGKLSPIGIELIDEEGKTFTFNSDGTTQQPYRIYRWDIGTELSIRKYNANKK